MNSSYLHQINIRQEHNGAMMKQSSTWNATGSSHGGNVCFVTWFIYFHSRKCMWKWRPFCLGLSVLNLITHSLHRYTQWPDPPAFWFMLQCFQKCPFEAINIINLPSNLEKDTTHRYNANSFKLHRYGFFTCSRQNCLKSYGFEFISLLQLTIKLSPIHLGGEDNWMSWLLNSWRCKERRHLLVLYCV